MTTLSSGMTPEATPEVTTTSVHDSPYNSRSIVITIGKGKKPFSVHEALLNRTGFFKVQGLPPAEDEKNRTKSSRSLIVANDPPIKQEDGALETVVEVDADYHIEDKFLFKPKAFTIFVNYLYGNNLSMPADKIEERTMFRAYGIARLYTCFSLQNALLDCLRSYYARTSIQIDDLIWATNRFGDNTDCALNAYLVEQLAFEISEYGLSDFIKQKNEFMVKFLCEGERLVRRPLFGALANIAKRARVDDPATAKRRFHVHETGALAGTLNG